MVMNSYPYPGHEFISLPFQRIYSDTSPEYALVDQSRYAALRGPVEDGAVFVGRSWSD